MFTDEQLSGLTELGKINPDVKTLLDFYTDAQKDGVRIIRLSLNSELIELSKALADKNENHDLIYDKIMEASKVLKRLPKPPKPERVAKEKGNYFKKKNGHEGKAII